MQKRLYDFNKENSNLLALTTIKNVDGRFLKLADRFWWAYTIAWEWQLDPREVKTWDSEDVMEALAAIGIKHKNKPKK